MPWFADAAGPAGAAVAGGGAVTGCWAKVLDWTNRTASSGNASIACGTVIKRRLRGTGRPGLGMLVVNCANSDIAKLRPIASRNRDGVPLAMNVSFQARQLGAPGPPLQYFLLHFVFVVPDGRA